MLECVYIVRNCVGNVVSVSDELPEVCRTVCETCGDYVARVEQAWFIRCAVEGVRDYSEVDPRAYGVSFTDIRAADELYAVYLVPECGEPDWERMYGYPVN